MLPSVASDKRSASLTQRLFVIGLSGFIGRHLQVYLAAAHAPWALLPVPHRYDLLEPDSLGNLWPELSDAVIHLAGQTYVPEAFRDPARTLQIDLFGTLNLFQAPKARGFSGTFLHISSGDIYGQVAKVALLIHEELIPHPHNPYAVSKLTAESLCLQWGITKGWWALAARPFNYTGPGQKDSFMIVSAARQIARMKQGLQANRLEVGDIDVSHDFLDVRDVPSAYLRLLFHDEAGAVHNVCSGQEQKTRELIELLTDIAQVELEIVQDLARMRRVEQRWVRGSHTRLYDAMGWKPEITIKQSLRATLSNWESWV